MSLQPCSNVDDVAVLGECCPSGRDSSLNLLFLVFVTGVASLSQVDVAFNVLDLNVVDVYWCVGFHHHLFLRLVHHCYFHQLISVAFAVAHIVYYHI